MIRKLLVASLLASALPAVAQVPAGNTAPQPIPFVDTIPDAVDTPYPGTLLLDVNGTNTSATVRCTVDACENATDPVKVEAP